MKIFSRFFLGVLALSLIFPSQQALSEESGCGLASGETSEGSASCGQVAMSLVEQEVSYTAGDTELKGFLVYDKSKTEKVPGVLVVHEWWGHNEYARERARKLAQEGYAAFALDMYGDGKTASHPKDAGAFSKAVFSDIENAKERFDAARNLLAAHPATSADKISAIGYCFGGGIVLNMARMGSDLRGVASFHGSLGNATGKETTSVGPKVVVFNGADDPFVTAEQIEAFKKEMTDAKADFEFVNYPGAKHSFTSKVATETGKKFDLPLAYDEEADTASWKALGEFLKEINR